MRKKDIKITLFDRLSEYEKISVLISKIPEIRYDRVNELKALISKGNYEIKPYQIVDKIIYEGIYVLKICKKQKCNSYLNTQ